MSEAHATNHRKQSEVANSKKVVKLVRADLPLSCPNKNSQLWASHPRVFLPIEDSNDGASLCPYCGTKYILEGGK